MQSQDSVEHLSQLSAIMKRAAAGKTTPDDKIFLYEICLTAAANELHRIETEAQGTVNPATLILIQEIAIAMSDDPQALKAKLQPEPEPEPDYECEGCQDKPITRMGVDNMDIYTVPCPDCGRDEWDYD